ncbi:MAG: M1 family metallopeptidase [Bacteroidia bacterium]|nr:M1 family metallopeptidase [Bacteroidia bacterium]
MKNILLVIAALGLSLTISAQQNPEAKHGFKFEQLGTMLPSPNAYRGADGAPGPDYWQQKVDYKIECSLDTKEQRLDGSERITYHNNAPTTLKFLWLQLDENEHDAHSEKHKFNASRIRDKMSERALQYLEPWREQEKYGCKIESCKATDGSDLKYTINGTVMRIELPEPLKTGEKFEFDIDWYYYLIDRINNPSGGRGGYEHFEDNDNYIYTIVQWFPRLCVYSDADGWQNKQFVGRGEFALEFGDYDVKMTVPADHMVGSTGECQNYKEVLTPTQLARWEQAQNVKEPLEIVTLAEAKAMEEQKRSNKMVTWHYKAENVRDFAWTASPKFVWDAMPHITEEGKKVMCMSYFAKEAYPIYSRYSTKATKHTLDVYSRMTFPYPYPVAISVEADNGMEYPMICFNPGRAEEDGTYTERAKYAALTVIIHEVGHNYFPMIVSNDERQWAWMDEGINSFLQFVAETEFDAEYKHFFTAPMDITGYMSRPKESLEPIMTNSENIKNYGSNAYNKPAGALNILRETVMGRELFDYAFKEYSNRWMFKHPDPSDFFRTMEDASGVDLDWFWRGWFYGTDAVDISLDSIKWYKVDLQNDPEPEEYSRNYPIQKPAEKPHISKRRVAEAGMATAVDKDPNLIDFYSTYDPWAEGDTMVTLSGTRYAESFSKKEKKKMFSDKNYYELHFSNKGGLVMPVVLEWQYKDGTTEIERIPVNIWRMNEEKFSKVFVKDKEVKGIVVDPYGETADIDLENNNWPVKELPSKFQVFKANKNNPVDNPMQKAAKKKVIRP